MEERGIKVETTANGDRYVLERLEEGGFNLGGEQSGHLILRDLATTGDGLLAAVHVMDVVRRTGRPLAELSSVVQRLPQVLLNVRVAGEAKAALAAADSVWRVVEQEAARLGDRG